MYTSTLKQVQSYQSLYERMATRVHMAALNALSQGERQLLTQSSQIAERDPRPWLKKGWTPNYILNKRL